MEIESQNSKQDYINFYKAYLTDDLKKKRIALVILFFVCVAFLNSNGFGWADLLIAMLSTLLIAAAYYFIPLLIQTIRLNILIAKENGYLEKRRYIITEDGFISKGSSTETKRNWASIKFAAINRAGIYIKLVDRKFLLIAKSNFQSDVDALNFLVLLKAHITKANVHPDFLLMDLRKSFDRGKPPYLWGWLGLVPLVGGLIGLGLIFFGFFKYKNKKLVVIGLAGVIFNVAVYGPLFYITKNFIKDGFATADTEGLNTIVKELEVYKIQEESYPDSLEQLNKSRLKVNIYDPLSSEINGKFNYLKFGKKYTLYSSGLDGKPNTDDDIFPTIDTNKIGLTIRINAKPQP